MRRLALTRTLVVGFALAYVLARAWYFGRLFAHSYREFDPVGIASLTKALYEAEGPYPVRPELSWGLTVLTVVSGAVFLRGRIARASGVVFFLSLLFLTTLGSSFGKILHTENLLVLHVGILAASAFFRDPERWTLRTMSIATVLTYLVAGIAKLRGGGVAWLTGRALGEWLAYDAVRKIMLGSFHSPIAGWVATSSVLCAVFAIFTLVVELGAPLALVSPRAARIWTALAWMFHLGILATMAIGFFYPLTGIAFASLLDLDRAPRLARVLEKISGKAL